MQLTVGTSPTRAGTTFPDTGQFGTVLVIQNLGPGDVFMDFNSAVTASTGVKIAVNGSYEVPRSDPRKLYFIATAANTDLRLMAID